MEESCNDFTVALVLNVNIHSTAARSVFGAFDVHCLLALLYMLTECRICVCKHNLHLGVL